MVGIRNRAVSKTKERKRMMQWKEQGRSRKAEVGKKDRERILTEKWLKMIEKKNE